MNGLLLTNVVSGGGWAGQLAVPDNSARPLRFRATSGSGVRGPWFDLISNKGGQTIKGTLTATGGFKGNVDSSNPDYSFHYIGKSNREHGHALRRRGRGHLVPLYGIEERA